MLASVQVEQYLPHCWIALYPATAWPPASACLYVFPPRLPVPEHCQEVWGERFLLTEVSLKQGTMQTGFSLTCRWIKPSHCASSQTFQILHSSPEKGIKQVHWGLIRWVKQKWWFMMKRLELSSCRVRKERGQLCVCWAPVGSRPTQSSTIHQHFLSYFNLYFWLVSLCPSPPQFPTPISVVPTVHCF